MGVKMNGVGCFVMFVVFLAVIIMFPFALLWAIYTIAPTLQAANPESAYDFWHWLAAFVIMALCGSGCTSKNSS